MSKKESTEPTTLSRSQEDREGRWKQHLGSWKGYAAAAAASLSLCTSADASIIYSGPINLTLTLPAAGPGRGTQTTEQTLIIGESRFSFGLQHHGTVKAPGMPSRGFIQTGEAFLEANFLGPNLYASGQAIPVIAKSGLFNELQFVDRQSAFCFTAATNYSSRCLSSIRSTIRTGVFPPGTHSGIVGFNVLGSAYATGFDKGWLRVKVSDRSTDGFPNELQVIDWAYNNTPGGAIAAGQTAGPVPEPSSIALSLFASGSAGLLAWRRRRKGLS